MVSCHDNRLILFTLLLMLLMLLQIVYSQLAAEYSGKGLD